MTGTQEFRPKSFRKVKKILGSLMTGLIGLKGLELASSRQKLRSQTERLWDRLEMISCSRTLIISLRTYVFRVMEGISQ